MREAAPLHLSARSFTSSRAPSWLLRTATLWMVLGIGFSAAAQDAPNLSQDAVTDAADAPASASVVSGAAFSAVDGDLARERAERALRRTGSEAEFPEGDDARNYAHSGIEVRERAIPRDIPLERLSGCAGKPKTMPTPGSGCNACSDCESLPSGSAAASTSSVLQILLAVLLLALIAGLLYRVLINRRSDFADALTEHELVLEARGLAEDAVESAANRGEYNIAIHALFLRTLLRISERGVAIRRDWTPREIPQLIALEDRERAPLRELVALAELARFADHRSSLAEFEQAQDASARLAAFGVAASRAEGAQ